MSEDNFSPENVPQENSTPPVNQETPSGGGGKALGIGVGIGIVIIVVCVLAICFIVGILCLLGPVVGSVFSNIVENLGTPTP